MVEQKLQKIDSELTRLETTKHCDSPDGDTTTQMSELKIDVPSVIKNCAKTFKKDDECSRFVIDLDASSGDE